MFFSLIVAQLKPTLPNYPDVKGEGQIIGNVRSKYPSLVATSLAIDHLLYNYITLDNNIFQ